MKTGPLLLLVPLALALATAPIAPLMAGDTNTLGTTIPVWPTGKMPGHGAPEPERELPSKGGNITRVSNVSDPSLTLYAPAQQAAAPPAMIICPGGGYRYVVPNLEGSEIAAWLNSLGITAVVLKYRVPDNRTGALQDLERSVRLVRAHAQAWHVDATRVGVIGFSAGGHLCARLSTTCATPAYPPVDAVDTLDCRPNFVALIYPAYLGDGGKVAPELPVTAALPPTFIAQAEDDVHYVAGTRLYAAALTTNGVPHEFMLYPTGGHGYGLRSKLAAKAWPEACRQWLVKLKVLPMPQ